MNSDKSKRRRVLYEREDVPDNYVDENFMKELEKLKIIKPYDYWSLVRESSVIIQEFSSVFLFYTIYIYMSQQILSAQHLLLSVIIVCLFAYSSKYFLLGLKWDTNQTIIVREDLTTVFIYLSFGYCLSPILMTLTKTISSDTIQAMTFFMFVAYLICHDYKAISIIVSQAISLNSAIFASVCLASRLSDSFQSFSLISTAFVTFAIRPIYMNILKEKHSTLHSIIELIWIVCSIISIHSISSLAATSMVIIFMVFVAFVCPAWLIKLQPHKNNIRGPWDEATIISKRT